MYFTGCGTDWKYRTYRQSLLRGHVHGQPLVSDCDDVETVPCQTPNEERQCVTGGSDSDGDGDGDSDSDSDKAWNQKGHHLLD